MATKLFSRNKKDAVAQEVTIDYPQDGDIVFQGHYAIRISVPSSGQAQISINKGGWQNCRPDAGYQWYDWWPEKAGRYQLDVRQTLEDGTLVKSETCSCVVKKINQN